MCVSLETDLLHFSVSPAARRHRCGGRKIYTPKKPVPQIKCAPPSNPENLPPCTSRVLHAGERIYGNLNLRSAAHTGAESNYDNDHAPRSPFNLIFGICDYLCVCASHRPGCFREEPSSGLHPFGSERDFIAD